MYCSTPYTMKTAIVFNMLLYYLVSTTIAWLSTARVDPKKHFRRKSHRYESARLGINLYISPSFKWTNALECADFL